MKIGIKAVVLARRIIKGDNLADIAKDSGTDLQDLRNFLASPDYTSVFNVEAEAAFADDKNRLLSFRAKAVEVVSDVLHGRKDEKIGRFALDYLARVGVPKDGFKEGVKIPNWVLYAPPMFTQDSTSLSENENE